MEQDDGFTLEKAKELAFGSLPVRRDTCPLYKTQGIKQGVFSSRSSDGSVHVCWCPSHCTNELNLVTLSATDCQLHCPSERLHLFLEATDCRITRHSFCSEQCNSPAMMDSMTSWPNMPRELWYYFYFGLDTSTTSCLYSEEYRNLYSEEYRNCQGCLSRLDRVF
jgi:hypothetical protein